MPYIGNVSAFDSVDTEQIKDGAVSDAKISDVDHSKVTGLATEISTAVSNLVDSSPESLNTLNELAAALGDDAAFSTTVTNSIALKAPLASPSFTGNVGVGTSSPAVQNNGAGLVLDIANTGSSSTTADNAEIVLRSSSRYTGLTFITPTDKASSVYFGDTADSDVGIIQYNHPTDSMAFTTNASERMRIDSSGKVGIGTSSPPKRLSVQDINNSNTAQLRLTDSTATTSTYLGQFSNGTRLTNNATYSGGWAADDTSVGVSQIELGDGVVILGTAAAGASMAATRLSINSDGAVTMPSQPACVVRPSGGWQNTSVYPAAIWNKLKFDYIGHQKGGSNFDTTNNRYNIPVSGYYAVHGQAYTGSHTYHHTAIYVNGSPYTIGGNSITMSYNDPQGSSPLNITWDGTYYFSAGDYVEWFFLLSAVASTSQIVYHGHAGASVILLS